MKKLILAFLLFCLPAQATTWYVKKSGSDSNSCALAQNPATPKLTIAGGLSCISLTVGAGAGHTVEVWAGTYTEQYITNWPTGTAWGTPFTLKVHAGDIVTIKPNAGQAPNGTLFFPGGMGSYVVVDGFTLDGSFVGTATASASQIAMFGGNHIRFINLDIINNGSGGTGQTVNGIFSSLATDVQIQFCKIHGGTFGTDGAHQGYGIYFASSDSLIENNEIYNCPRFGIHNYNSITPKPARNTYRNNNIHDCTQNLAFNYMAGMILGSGDGNVAYNNIVRNGGGHGIQIGQGATNTKVYNNTIYNNPQDGISYQACDIVDIKNNIVYANGGTINQAPGYTCTNVTQATNSTTNPTFVNTSLFDFHLQGTSNAKTGGTTLALVPVDKDGFTRPQGATYSIGAYEYVNPDVTAPVISSIATPSILDTSIIVTWTTNEVSDSQVEYGLTTGYGTSTTLDSTLVTSHSVTVTGLSATTLYHFRVKSRDASTNLANSADQIVTTVANPFTATIALIYPDGGERFVVGSVVPITWSSDDPGNLRVRFSYDGGATYPVTVSSSVAANLGTVNFTVPPPATITALGKIEVCSLTQPSVCAVSSSGFIDSGFYIK